MALRVEERMGEAIDDAALWEAQEIRGQGYSLCPEPDGRILIKIDEGPWLRLGGDDYRDAKHTNLDASHTEALHWLSEVKSLSLRVESKSVARRRRHVEDRVKAGLIQLGFPHGDAAETAMDAAACAVDDMFIHAPLRFATICCAYVAAWENGHRPSLTLSQLSKVLGGRSAKIRQIEARLGTGYCPDSKALRGTEPYEVLLTQGDQGELSAKWWN
jgi:hypothetical protein